MPKATKNTKRASTASNKKLSLKSRFSLRSKKVQFFVVIGIVAILGGGYYVRQSFAASYAWYYSLAYGNMKTTGTLGPSGPDCGVTPMTDTEKNKANVIGVLCQAANPLYPGKTFQSAGPVKFGGGRATKANFGYWAVGKNFRTCAVMRATTDGTNVIVQQTTGTEYGSPGFVRTVGPIAKAPYSTVCTPWQKIIAPISATHEAGIVPRSGGVTAGYVAEIRIEQQ